jgi:ribose 5-phosphate isomerase RpiB
MKSSAFLLTTIEVIVIVGCAAGMGATAAMPSLIPGGGCAERWAAEHAAEVRKHRLRTDPPKCST